MSNVTIAALTQMFQVTVDGCLCENVVIVVEVRCILKLLSTALGVDDNRHAVTVGESKLMNVAMFWLL